MRHLLFVLLLIPTVLLSQSVTDSLVGYWPFNGNANDMIGTNHGTVYNAQQNTDLYGNPNTSYRFIPGHYISMGDPAILDFGAEEFTISLWTRLSASISGWNGVLMSKWNSSGYPGTNEWFIGAGNYLGAYPSLAVEINDTSFGITSSTELNLNQWYNIVAIRRSTSLELYVNGSLVAQRTIPSGSLSSTVRNVEVGRFHINGAGGWLTEGKIDDIMVFNRAIDVNEVQAILADGVSNSDNLIHLDATNFGIGTADTRGYKLAVAGKIISEEVKVALLENWPDFVFDEEYNLQELEEIQEYIADHKHLPGIPSEAEVKENGILLGDMNAKLLQKIEELTLHMIEMNRRLDALEKENKKLKESISPAD